MNEECETCIKRKTVYCPNSIECMATDDKPYYQNRIMLLEENQELKKQLEEYKDKINWYENFEVNKTIDKLRLKHNTQQKGFIKWLEDIIDSYKYSNIDDYKNVLQKYKEIIGVPMAGVDLILSPEHYEEYKGTLQDQLEEAYKEIDRLNNIINETRRILGQYAHYSTPTEEQNAKNEAIVDEAYIKLHGNVAKGLKEEGNK